MVRGVAVYVGGRVRKILIDDVDDVGGSGIPRAKMVSKIQEVIWLKYEKAGTHIFSGQIIIFHQPRFPWNNGISLTKPPFGVRSCEVAIIWPDIFKNL